MIYFYYQKIGGGFMAGNYFSPFSLRISEELLEKIKFIASNNKRSANKEIEFILENAVKDYEKQNGEISIPND
jgi:hypothetical protein